MGISSRWDQHTHCSSSASPMGSFVNGPRVVCAVRRNGSNGVRDLLEQSRDRGAIMCPASRQILCDDLTCIGINRQVEFPPSPSLWRLSQGSHMNPEPRTIDEQMDRLTVPGRMKRDYAELLETSRQSRMVWNWQINSQHTGQGTKEPLGLSKRKVEDHPNRQRCLDGNVSICALTAGSPAGRFPPGGDPAF